MHECKRDFYAGKIEGCSGYVFKRCYENAKGELILETGWQDNYGIEIEKDGWESNIVDFCPYCGYQPERLNDQTPKGDAIV